MIAEGIENQIQEARHHKLLFDSRHQNHLIS